MARFVILDRDGVINEDSPAYIKTPADWRPVPGALEAIALLTRHGVEVFVATNQSGIARGHMTEGLLHAIHEKMLGEVAAAGGRIKEVRFCPHHPRELCECRKPRPGMLLDLARRHRLELAGKPFVGDSLRDLECAEAAGCLPVLVLTGNGERTLRQRPGHEPVYGDLLEFAREFVDRETAG